MGNKYSIKTKFGGGKIGKAITPLNDKLKNVEWGEYKYDKLFKLCVVKNKLTKLDLEIDGKIPVYSSDSSNNGIVGFTNKEAEFIISKDNPIYIVFGDHTISFNIATESFCVMDNVKVLIVNSKLTINELLYIIASWKKSVPSKGYARHWSLAKKVLFNLPKTIDGKIDFDFMKSFVAEIEAERIEKLKKYLSEIGLSDYHLTEQEKQALESFENLNWETFNLENLFGKSTRGKRLKSADRISGTLPFITAGETDEGVSAFIGNDVTVFSANTTTIDMFGSAKYRNFKYGGDDHIAVVHTDKLPIYASVFVTSSIHKSSYNGQFNYGRNFYAKDADALDISLPVKDNKPDYETMGTVISAIHKLVIKDVILYVERKN